jgi:hypothetical protein
MAEAFVNDENLYINRPIPIVNNIHTHREKNIPLKFRIEFLITL